LFCGRRFAGINREAAVSLVVIPIVTFAGRKIAVFGLGGSGLVSAQALLAGGADVVAFDDNADSLKKAEAAGIPTADLRALDWSKLAALVLAPGVPLTHPQPHWSVALAHKAAVPVIGDIELFCRERRRLAPAAPFVAITGTNGKSTTTALTAHLAASTGMDAQLGGNIGTAILSLEPPQASDIAPTRVHVVECSSYQIDLAPSLDPSIGILINLSEDHLDRHGTMAHYADVKARLVAGVPQGGAAIVGVDDEWCRAIADHLAQSGKHLVRISVRGALSDGIYAEGPRIVRAIAGKATPIADLTGIGSLRGVHNAQNAACASAAALALGLSPAAIQAGLRSFPGLAHRMEEVGRDGNVLFVNDSKATNADSAAQALVCFDDIFWIAGGKPKTGGIESLRGFFPRIRKAYLIGEAADEFAATLGDDVPHETTGTLDKAVAAAARDAALSRARQPVVLLSPACASFDQYRNFEVRGDAFRALVQALPGVASAGRR
jgi:UDP-N-acetylmuramoylalanine--D-glutamate ligase